MVPPTPVLGTRTTRLAMSWRPTGSQREIFSLQYLFNPFVRERPRKPSRGTPSVQYPGLPAPRDGIDPSTRPQAY